LDLRRFTSEVLVKLDFVQTKNIFDRIEPGSTKPALHELLECEPIEKLLQIGLFKGSESSI
jgi:hypothetical protein